MSKLLAFISTFALLFVMIGVIAYERYYAPPGGFLHRTIDAPAIVKQVQQLSELVTVRYTVEKVIGMTEDKRPMGSESILLLVQGRVMAGVDLSGLTQYDVIKSGKSVKVRIPAARVTEAFLDEKYTKVWDRHITWWTPWVPYDPELEHKARLAAIADVRQAALDMGILKQAQQNAETAIRRFLQALGFETVTTYSAT